MPDSKPILRALLRFIPDQVSKIAGEAAVGSFHYTYHLLCPLAVLVLLFFGELGVGDPEFLSSILPRLAHAVLALLRPTDPCLVDHAGYAFRKFLLVYFDFSHYPPPPW